MQPFTLMLASVGGWLRQRSRALIAASCLVLSLTLAFNAFYMQAKAQLAQWLIADAWQQTVQTQQPQKPWPWADTWPVAKLTTPSQDVLYVLNGSSGEALAFGPGMMQHSARQTNVTTGAGTVAIAGHRDSHFNFLQHSQPGDVFELELADGRWLQYQMQVAEVIDSRDENVSFQYQYDELKLISCYPFNTLASNGPLRYVLSALPLPLSSVSQAPHS